MKKLSAAAEHKECDYSGVIFATIVATLVGMGFIWAICFLIDDYVENKIQASRIELVDDLNVILKNYKENVYSRTETDTTIKKLIKKECLQ